MGHVADAGCDVAAGGWMRGRGEVSINTMYLGCACNPFLCSRAACKQFYFRMRISISLMSSLVVEILDLLAFHLSHLLLTNTQTRANNSVSCHINLHRLLSIFFKFIERSISIYIPVNIMYIYV